MATSSLLDFDTLLAPIAGDNPAGDPLGYTRREELDELRKEVNPEDYPPDDPMRPDEKKADWAAVVRETQSFLTESGKDLMVAARLTEALSKRHGFAGLRDGLRLMRRMLEDCWDRLHPVIEEPDDLERRASAFNWLDDPDRGARFPTALRQVTLVSTNVGGEPPYTAVVGYGYNDWKLPDKGAPKVPPEEFERTMRNTPVLFLQTLREDMEECKQEIADCLGVLNTKLESFAPALTEIRQAFVQNYQVFQGILQQRPDLSGSADGSANSSGESGSPGAAGGVAGYTVHERAIASREDVYNQIGQLAEVLKKMEPHSPIPYLLGRAVELGRMPFPVLIKQLIREPNMLSELYREFGINPDSTE